MFVTLFFGMLSPKTGEVLYCNAGHNPPYRVNGGKPQAIEDAHGLTLGIRPQAAYQTGTLVLAPGETLLLFSDGVTEAHDPGDNLFCEHWLEAVLCTHAGRGSRELIGGVTEALKGLVGTRPTTSPCWRCGGSTPPHCEHLRRAREIPVKSRVSP